MAQLDPTCEHKIGSVEPTHERLTDRGGLVLFVKYLAGIKIYSLLDRYFGKIRKSTKGVSIMGVFKQLLCFFFDGTKFSLTRFDELKMDEGYAHVIESDVKSMCSSHSIKRFFNAFSYIRIWLFRKLLQELFIWRLNVEKPKEIILGVDVMVMDNDEAQKREGVEPTYQGVKGFAPLQLNWGPYIIDSVFRGGSKHSNNGDTVAEMVEHIVKVIRKRYREDVPIIIRCDSAFFDQENFRRFEKLGIGYVCGGKLYEDIKGYVMDAGEEYFGRYSNGHQSWDFLEFGNRRGTWDKFRRTIYCRPYYDEKQMVISFCRPETVIITNLGADERITKLISNIGRTDMLTAERIKDNCLLFQEKFVLNWLIMIIQLPMLLGI